MEEQPVPATDLAGMAAVTAAVQPLFSRIEPFPASHGDIYRVRAMDVNTPVDNFDAMIASHGNGLLAKA
jgi:hypothetical protein